MTDEIQIGDYIECDLGMGLGAIGIVVTEHAFRGGRENLHIMRENNKTFRIHFLDGSTHTAFPDECRKLTGKELFKAKLSDDKRIYE
ncbi:MAG: hypothetical protein ACQ9ET_02690, partial [Nitrosomonadaceae bacterium]